MITSPPAMDLSEWWCWCCPNRLISGAAAASDDIASSLSSSPDLQFTGASATALASPL
ncbi:hypothetical protein Syun_010345 [Stephania yunnanensis]|uniref:Uncharacterized protein n=1 Tax=Stephania yunnanensis TaxID=152371 RepID=A0AAP0PT62_9MAGN